MKKSICNVSTCIENVVKRLLNLLLHIKQQNYIKITIILSSTWHQCAAQACSMGSVGLYSSCPRHRKQLTLQIKAAECQHALYTHLYNCELLSNWPDATVNYSELAWATVYKQTVAWTTALGKTQCYEYWFCNINSQDTAMWYTEMLGVPYLSLYWSMS